MTKTYRDQYERMMRWYSRLEKTHKLYNADSDIYKDYYEDFLYAFFQNCYHLKDWIINDATVLLPNKKNVIECFIKCNECMKVCGDLCNGSKHFILDRRPRIDANTQIKGKFIDLELKETFGSNESEIDTSIDLQVQLPTLRKSCRALSLARDCIEQWDNFISQHKL